MLGSLLLSVALAGSSWRHDGTGIFPASELPTSWSETESVVWQTPLSSWGNASPVVTGELVCVTVEPTTLTCMSRADGVVRWSQAHPVIEALPPEQAAPLRGVLEQLDRDLSRQTELQQRASKLSRAARRGDETAEAELVVVSAELMGLKTAVHRYADYLTPPEREQIGYATSTPATDGKVLYALFGNGVLAAHNLKGEPLWQRWLGPLQEQMRGYGVGHGASPLWVDGVLVVPWGHLRGVDPTTGNELWQGPTYTDYGTPAVVRSGGNTYVVTPAGEVVSPASGEVTARHHQPLYWASPTAVGSSVLFVGGAGKAHSGEVSNRAWRLQIDTQGGLSELWNVPIATGERIYSSPVVHNGSIYAVDDTGKLHILDLQTGAPRGTLHVHSATGHLPSLVASGDLLLVGNETGSIGVVKLGASPELLRTNVTGSFRSTPAPIDGRIYLRTLSGVVAIGSR